MLEPNEGKLSRSVLRRGGESNLASLSRRKLYGPDLLFHQQYPTQMCGKVTTRTEPADTVPTVTRLAPEPRGNGVSASIRRRRGWMDGTVNTRELSINVVMSNKPKMLIGLSQKGTVAGHTPLYHPV